MTPTDTTRTLRHSYAARILLLLWLCVVPFLPPLSSLHAQEGEEPGGNPPPVAVPPAQVTVDELLSQMSPEERVGQLFLVTFPGDEVDEESIVSTLITDVHIGGVVLRASNGNYLNSGDTAGAITGLTNELQQSVAATAAENETPFVPLFIGMDLISPSSVYADGLPQNGFTRLPSEMALGATWDLNYAIGTGQIVGQEMSAIGVNLLLGPMLDVVDQSGTEPRQNLATATFGGNPYWVGRMGSAFVQGVETGSGGRMATIAGHFPGIGSSDRGSDDEIATVQKPLVELQQTDLAPFYEITSGSIPPTDTHGIDGLLTSHVRYRALQGNIRQTTRPLSLDAQSLPTLLTQPEIQAWRGAGGILVSDELGAVALRRFYQQQQDSFPARTVARDAFNAGNDLLFLGDFAMEDAWETRLENIVQTHSFFTEQYVSDPVFATRVDASVRRILQLKLRLYGGDLSTAASPLENPSTLVPSPLRTPDHLNLVARIAQESATLLYPTSEDLSGILPSPPLGSEDMLIVTDARPVRDCLTCPVRSGLDPLELENQLLQRFGPTGSGELDPARLNSLTLTELDTFLAEGSVETEDGLDPAVALAEAEWLVFLVQDKDPAFPASDALSEFLRTYNPQLRDQRIIVFVFGAPYYLDATEISKITAYYALYTPTPRFVDAAVSLLFQAIPATGFAPVSVYPVNYDVEERLNPTPNQTVALCRDVPEAPLDTCIPLEPTLDVSAEGEATKINLRTGIIHDYNGNPVPDGTRVDFVLRYPSEGVEQRPQTAYTQDGVAASLLSRTK